MEWYGQNKIARGGAWASRGMCSTGRAYESDYITATLNHTGTSALHLFTLSVSSKGLHRLIHP
jgi:hypothetical protein